MRHNASRFLHTPQGLGGKSKTHGKVLYLGTHTSGHSNSCSGKLGIGRGLG